LLSYKIGGGGKKKKRGGGGEKKKEEKQQQTKKKKKIKRNFVRGKGGFASTFPGKEGGGEKIEVHPIPNKRKGEGKSLA